MDGRIAELEITGVAHGGVFVGRLDGRVVFVPDAIPGERVLIRTTDESKASFWRGEVLEVLDASPHRRGHVWAQADLVVPAEDRPGGADFGHIALDHQRALKADVLNDSLRRFARIDADVAVRPAGGPGEEDPAGLRWRTRVSLHVDADGLIGPFGARSHRVVPVSELPLASAEIERAARRVRGAEGRIDLVQPADGRVRVIPRPERRGRHRPGAEHEVVVERVRDREFRVDAGGFWQVHRLAAETLHDLVAAHLGDEGGGLVDPDGRHLDLYGGVGLFAATLGGLGGATTRVTSVESDPRATEHAGENLAPWVGMRAETGRVDRWLRTLLSTASATERTRLASGVVVLDPPRAGAGKEVVRSVAEVSPSRIVYVACDPVALARDLATFADTGYVPTRVDALDLFPHSHHVETVVSLRRDEVQSPAGR